MLSQIIAKRVQRACAVNSLLATSQTQFRFFAAAAAPTGKAVTQEPATKSELRALGVQNVEKLKSFDYSQFAHPNIHGVTNKKSSFKSFEDHINTQFPLVQTAPTDRNSRRVGLLGYKIGMTHFWNKWG